MPLEDTTEDFLAHYGVMGMHWGIRKDRGATSHVNYTDPQTGAKKHISYDPGKVTVTRNRDGSLKVVGNKKATASVLRQINVPTPHPDHKIARETLKRPLISVSNKDLQATNQRLNLEKQYSQLRYERSTVGKGQAHVKTTLALVGTGLAVGVTLTKLATPENIKRAKAGLEFIRKATRH